MTRKTRVYISGPMLTSGNPYLNVRDGVRAGSTLMRKGYLPFVPHLTAVWEMASHEEFGRDDWMGLDFEYVRMSDAVLRLPGDSRGADEECALAKSLNIPVYYSIDTLCAGMANTVEVTEYTITPDDESVAAAKLLAEALNAIAEELNRHRAIDRLVESTIPHDFKFNRMPKTEGEWVLATFLGLLQAATGDGAKKRARGEKPPWWRDPSHRAAIFSHLNKWEHGERKDADSGVHPFVHLAWRALAIAYQETHGMVDPAAPKPSETTNHRPGIDGIACGECPCGSPVDPCRCIGCPHCWPAQRVETVVAAREDREIHECGAYGPSDEDPLAQRRCTKPVGHTGLHGKRR